MFMRTMLRRLPLRLTRERLKKRRTRTRTLRVTLMMRLIGVVMVAGYLIQMRQTMSKTTRQRTRMMTTRIKRLKCRSLDLSSTITLLLRPVAMSTLTLGLTGRRIRTSSGPNLMAQGWILLTAITILP